MVKKLTKELHRKGIHISTLVLLFLFIYLSHTFSKQIGFFALVLVLTFALGCEFIRLDLKKKPPVLSQIWKHFKRKKEAHFMGGEVFQIAGIIVTLAAFDIRIAVAAILMLTFGDPAAALIGIKYGKNQLYKKKTWEGTFAFFITSLVIGLFCIQSSLEPGTWYILSPAINQAMWLPIFGMALAAAITELFVNKIDDNLAVPLIAGIVGQLLLLL